MASVSFDDRLRAIERLISHTKADRSGNAYWRDHTLNLLRMLRDQVLAQLATEEMAACSSANEYQRRPETPGRSTKSCFR